MGMRPNMLKSINTMKSLPNFGCPTHCISSDSSRILQKTIEELLNDPTITTSTSDPLNSDINYPIPYTFRVVLPENSSKANHAKCPPFYMQLDHTIAVLWHVFAHHDFERKKNIGVGQLQWALFFLKGLKDPLEGTRQADINIAIKAIEDALIESYAEMANLIMQKPQMKVESLESSLTTTSSPKIANKIGTCVSLGMMVKPRKSFCRIENLNISSLSYTTFQFNSDISTTLAELIKFRKATQEQEKKSSTINVKSTTVIKSNDIADAQLTDPYEKLKQLREDQVKKLKIEIENLKKLEEAASVRTYFKILLQYFQSFTLWKAVYRVALVTIRLIFDQFRMDDIFVD